MKIGCKSKTSIQHISDLINIVLTKYHFQFNRNNYLQKLGTAMGTRMAPSYASLFMGKFEKEFLDSCNIQPLLWLCFPDDIFMIWNDSKEQRLMFLYEINQYHETIQVSYGYSQSEAVFLDVKVEKSYDGMLMTSVYEKDTNVRQSIVFSSCHPTSYRSVRPNAITTLPEMTTVSNLV